jgi:hypothetical protein
VRENSSSSRCVKTSPPIRVAEEVGPEQAALILRRYVRQVRITAPFFDARRTDPLESFVAEAGRHPVFRLRPPA